MKKIRTWIFIVVNLLVISALYQIANSVTITDLQAESAALKLDQVKAGTIYALKGDWEYFPGKLADEINGTTGELVTVEHLWPKNEEGFAYGTATYRLTLSGLNPLSSYGIFVRDEASAYRLLINGRTVMYNGVVSKNPSIYKADLKTATTVFKSDQNGKAVLVMEIANYDRSVVGGFWNPVMVGSINAIDDYFTHPAIAQVFIMATMLTLSLFFLLLSTLDVERHSLYMSIFSAAVAFRVFSTGMHLDYEIFPWLSFMTLVRLEYLSGYLLLPIVGLLIESFGFTKPNKVVRTLLISMIPLMLLFTLLAPDAWLEASYLWFEIVVVMYVLHAIYLIYNGLKRKIEGAWSIVIGILILAAGSLIDLFFPNVEYALYFASFISVLTLGLSVMISFSAVRSRKEHLETEILVDHLTKVGNRAGLFKELTAAKPVLPDQERYILFIDLNKFKQINDDYGHEVGDAVLIEAANRFKKCTRSTDMIFRYGGDEFVILADIAATSSIDTVLNRLKAGFNDPFVINELSLKVTVAIGYERYDPIKQSSDEILKRSDMKMYEQKRQMNT